jgi:hypothetical protein
MREICIYLSVSLICIYMYVALIRHEICIYLPILSSVMLEIYIYIPVCCAHL